MQGRFKRDGGAAGAPEPRGGAVHDSTPQHTPDVADEVLAAPTPQEPGPPDDAAAKTVSRLRLRNWRISTRLMSLLVLPVAAATGLGMLRIQGSLDNLGQLDHMGELTDLTRQATLLAGALQEERDESAGPLASGQSSKDDSVAGARAKTDAALKSYDKVSDLEDDNLIGVRSSLLQIEKQLQDLKRIRDSAYTNPNYAAQTVSSYDALITSLLGLSQDMALATNNDAMINSTRALNAFSSAMEYESIQRAIISAALANPDGAKISDSDRNYARSAQTNEDGQLDRFSRVYGSGAASLLKGLEGGIAEIAFADQYRYRVLKTSRGIESETKSYMDWYDQATVKINEMERIQTQLLGEMEQEARQLRSDAQQDALINGALILLVLGVAVVGAVVVARSMIRSLRRLQDSAQDVAQRRLPELVRELSEADPQDVDTTVESVGVNSSDEIGRVARAFDEVHREAVRLAAEQALLRGNVNAMFTNLSRRSQGLIQRQLTLISELESREADPDQLSNLFKMDHLATRMRRNGENLLVLAGEEPGRRWTRPVPLVDVLRAAASEVEQYERIELTAVPATEVAGRVVNDLVHLLAELLENATSFSSPQTRVRVTGHALPDGRVLIEIHDTGIGLSPDDLAAINERLANPPTVDVSVSRRMGLFVVGRLSLRHGIRIQLRPSDSGGTTALVMLPVDVTQNRAATPGQRGPRASAASPPRGQLMGDAEPRKGLPRRPAGQQQQSRPGRPESSPAGPPTHRHPSAEALGAAPADPVSRHRPSDELPAAPLDRAGLGNIGSPGTQDSAAGRPPVSHRHPSNDALRAAHTDPASHRHPSNDALGAAPTDPAGRPPLPQRPAFPEPGPDERFPGHRGADATLRFSRPLVPGDGLEGPETGSADRQDYPGYQDYPDRQGYPDYQDSGYEHRRASQPQPAPRAEHQLPPAAEPMALPPAPSNPNERTPIFETVESDWFRSGRAERMQAVRVSGEPAAPPPSAAPEPPPPSRWNTQPNPRRRESQYQAPPSRGPVRRRPERTPDTPGVPHGWDGNPYATSRGTVPPRARVEAAEWRTSPNDERWRRAEQVREPTAGGVTSSGLPRRVPRANLVPGTAQQTSKGGPQVSRAPDDVRGRLTNLRRGIQRGRQAGTERYGFGPYPQER